MQDVERYEILILGSGEAGKYLAWTMAKAGHRTAMVERKYLGGSCPNVACLPSKNLIYSAKVASLARRGAEFGLEIDSLSVNMADVQRRKRIMVEGLHQLHVDREAASGGELIMGNARFVAPRTVEVALTDGGTRTIFADRVILAVGSRATMPEVPGLSAVQPMTHIEALDLDRLPEHLIVMGGGYVGLELAQAMRRFGSHVTVIEAAPQLASREDPDVGAALLELFRDEGIDVFLETHVTSVEGRSGEKIRIHAKDRHGERTLEGTDLLVATGRTANTDGIGLEQTGVELSEHGYIKVNERLQTTAANIWAMGDCAGSPQFTHVAFDDFRVVSDNLNGGNRTTKNRLVPFCMFTDPELARVGRNESEARRDGMEYRVAKMRTADVLRTRTVSEPRGFLKVLIGANSDEILGFTAFGFEASELMTAVQTAMIGRMPYTMLRDAIFTHPTMSEGLIGLMASVPARTDGSAGRPGAPERKGEPVNEMSSVAESILEQMADAAIYADNTGTIMRWNHAAAALFGYSAAEALGQTLDLIIPEHLQAAHWRGFEAATRSGVTKLQGRPTLTRATHRTGRKLYVEMTFSLVKGQAGARGAVGVARDVTERIEQQRADARRDSPG